MIRLEKDIEVRTSTSSNEHHEFAKKVLQQMQTDSIAPTPYNFQIYFETLLDETSPEYKKKIHTIRQDEADSSDEQRVKMEREIKESFAVIKNIVQSIASTYKNISLLRSVIKKYNDELSTTNNQLSIKNITSNFGDDIRKFDTLVGKQLALLKGSYEQALISLKSIERGAIYDTRYSIYNRKYLLYSIENEKKSIKNNGYSSSLMFIKIKDSILSKIPSNKDRLILTKNIAKLLQRTSRRSDVVAHYGEGIFAMVMKHTNLESAKKACERVSKLVYGSSFFIGETDIDIEIEISLIELSGKNTLEETLASVLDALPKSSKNGMRYVIASYE